MLLCDNFVKKLFPFETKSYNRLYDLEMYA